MKLNLETFLTIVLAVIVAELLLSYIRKHMVVQVASPQPKPSDAGMTEVDAFIKAQYGV